MSSKIAIVSYGTGNLNSVKRALDRIRVDSTITSNPNDLASADKIIFPGVGHFERAMASLRKLDLLDTLNEAVLVKGTPILGICLGMELMAKSSEEGNVEGLGWLDAHAVRFSFPTNDLHKVPHMGWNGIGITKKSKLMDGVDPAAEFYFAHSYYLQVRDDNDVLNETEYGIRFTSAIERSNIFGVQYHPEKSHDAGRAILRNFVHM